MDIETSLDLKKAPVLNGPRPCRPSEVTHWIRFLNGIFEYQSPQSYGVDFANLFESSNLKNSSLILGDNQIIASGSLLPHTVLTPLGNLNLGVIGAVATHPLFRRQGLSTWILEILEAQAKALGLDGVILWSDQNEFYTKRGYQMAGHQRLIPLRDLPQPRHGIEGTVTEGWNSAEIAALYAHHSMRVDRSPSYWQTLEGVTSCNRFQWIDNTCTPSRCLAYVGIDRGKDMVNVIHEWGGDRVALYQLVAALVKRWPDLVWMTHPRLHDPVGDLAAAPQRRDGLEGLPTTHLALCKQFKPLSADAQTELNEKLEYLWFWGLDSA